VKVAELVTNVLSAIAAILGLAGYVLLLGAAVLWLRLNEVDLPPEVPVSLASREELIVIGAQAVAVWVVLAAVLGGMAAWIVSGTPERRRFGYHEAGLSLTVALSILLALEGVGWLAVLPGIAVVVALAGCLLFWPSADAVAAVALPLAFAVALGLSLSFLGDGSQLATSAGATFIFGSLVLLTPRLQRWRARQEANQTALARLEVEDGEKENPLVVALKQAPARPRSTVQLWVERVSIALLILLILGIVSVTSQVDRDGDFRRALISLTNGDCIEGTYLVRGNEQIVIAQPEDNGAETQARIAVIPVKEVLDAQIYSSPSAGSPLVRKEQCQGVVEQLVRPAETAASKTTSDE
jgi:hypothetical protein